MIERTKGDQTKALLKAIRNYAQYGEVPDFGDDAALDIVWPVIEQRIVADNERYERIRETRSEAGSKGGKARASNLKQKQANEANAMPDKQIKPSPSPSPTPIPSPTIDNGADKPPSPRFIPPTVEEVREYCLSRNNSVDPARFVAYYTSNGWMVGRNKMKDWKSAVHTWERSEYNKSTEVMNGRTKADNPKTEWQLPGVIKF